MQNLVKTKEQIDRIKESAKINVAVLDYVAAHIRAGVTTQEIDQWVYDETVKYHAVPAPLNYDGYPKSVCTSVDHVVCHGIPSPDQILKEGDIVNIDVSTDLNGYFSDSSRMFCIGEVTADKRRLVEAAKTCLDLAVEQVRPGGHLGDIGHVILKTARKQRFSVVREIGGHGIGLAFHEDPWVSHVARKGTGTKLVPGMIFTIEPMINMGRPEVEQDPYDGWTIYTVDRKPSAQWEKQVLVTEEGYEILAY